MNTLPVVGISIVLILIVLLALVAVAYRRKEGQVDPDYRAFFIIGVTWLPLGIATENPAFWGMGAIFMAVGLANRDKWKDEKRWSNLSASERGLKLMIILGLTLVITAGFVAFYLAQR